MSKKSTLLSGMAAAAGKQVQTASPPTEEGAAGGKGAKSSEGTVMIGAHYPREVRSALKFLEAHTGRKLKPLLSEAINDLCAKYGKAQPCTIEE